MTPHDLFDEIDRLPGFMGSRQQMAFMYTLATRTRLAAEIGAYKGKSSVLVGAAMATGTNGLYYCIDTFQASNAELPDEDTWDTWSANIKRFGLKNRCIPVRGLSHEVVTLIPRDLEWVYIDGNHEVRSVVLDTLSYYDKVVQGGFFLFHDQPWPGVTAATNWLVTGGYLHPITVIDDFGVYSKTGKIVADSLIDWFTKTLPCPTFALPVST